MVRVAMKKTTHVIVVKIKSCLVHLNDKTSIR